MPVTVDTLENRLAETVKPLSAQIVVCRKYGGFCSVVEARDILGISRQRVSFLVANKRFRTLPPRYAHLYPHPMLSLADVLLYKDTRRPGRPVGANGGDMSDEELQAAMDKIK